VWIRRFSRRWCRRSTPSVCPLITHCHRRRPFGSRSGVASSSLAR
jgi:hypothetical protein